MSNEKWKMSQILGLSQNFWTLKKNLAQKVCENKKGQMFVEMQCFELFLQQAADYFFFQKDQKMGHLNKHLTLLILIGFKTPDLRQMPCNHPKVPQLLVY